jgi:deoxyribodipyrimidine photo-lyase
LVSSRFASERQHSTIIALSNHDNIQPIFIFDPNILDDLKDRTDARVQFIHEQLERLNQELITYGATLWVFHGKPIDVFKNLIERYHINAVYANHDYEPYAIKRDVEINNLLLNRNISFHTYKDQVIFEKS